MGTIERCTCPSYTKVFTIYLWLSVLFAFVHGGWEDPPFEIDPNGIGGITSENGVDIKILENTQDKDAPGAFPLAKLRLAETHVVTITGDSRFTVIENPTGDWYLTAAGPFDFEALGDPRFVLRLDLDGGGSNDLDFLVVVEDENDNIPKVIEQVPDPIPAIPEGETRTDPILTITAVDDDVADNGKLLFELEELNGGDSFEVNQKGEVYLMKALNYSQRTSHRLNIKINDPRPPDHIVPVSVIVLVDDVPNIPPDFTKPPIIRSVTEEIVIGTSVSITQARDGDFGLNWPIEYTIIDDALGLFEIDKDTGNITVKARIDAEDEKIKELDWSYSFKVLASEIYDRDEYGDLDPSLTEAEVEVAFAIVDINDQPPLICTELDQDGKLCKSDENYAFEIPEDHTGPISFTGDLVLRVVDLDFSTNFNRFNAAIDPNSEDIIKEAFTISPAIGLGDTEFFIQVTNPTAIDFERDEWHNEDGDPITKTFTIVFTGTNDASHIARANFQVTVTDVNDKTPVFTPPDGQTEFNFTVCENTENGLVLRKVVLPTNPEYPNSCRDSTLEDELFIVAKDDDITPEFGSASIIYRWSQTTRQPPITLGSKNGSMTMMAENGNGFDYERFKVEIFTVEAVDKEGDPDGNVASIPVHFTILDRNDETVDLKFKEGYRTTIEENTTISVPVLTGITATDVDESGNISWNMTVINAFTRVAVAASDNGLLSPKYKKIELTGELEDSIDDWFDLELLDGGTDRSKEFQIVLGTKLPDREGYGEQDVASVELNITVEDVNSENGPQIAFQTVTIFIEDINDNPPEWPPGENMGFSVSVTEIDWLKNETDPSENEGQRVISPIRVTDKDRDTQYEFSLSTEGCNLGEQICAEILDMFEISDADASIGTRNLRRKHEKQIDRDDRTHFPPGDTSDILYITIVASDTDGKHSSSAKFQVKVEDINDNTPVFAEDYASKIYEVDENVDETQNWNIQISATDKDHPDKYGKVSYLLSEEENSNGTNEFEINLDGGQITAKYDENGKFGDWFEITNHLYRLHVIARDWYRPASSSGSNEATTFIIIKVIDKNNHAPEFLPDGKNISLSIGESELKANEKFATIQMQDKDDPDKDNGKFTVEITGVEIDPPPTVGDPKDWFKVELIPKDALLNTKELSLFPTRNFVGLWGNYTITLKASDGENSDGLGQLSSELFYFLTVDNENLNAPVFDYPSGNETRGIISIPNSKPNEQLMNLTDNTPIPNVSATDKDASSGRNGKVSYEFEYKLSTAGCEEVFQIDSESGMITLKNPVDDSFKNLHCKMVIKAQDGGDFPNADFRVIELILVVEFNTDPEFPYVKKTINIMENSSDVIYTSFEPATDEDIENGNVYRNESIHYFLKGGAINEFELVDPPPEGGDPTLLYIKARDGVVLDREAKDLYLISIYATNFPDEAVDDWDIDDILKNNTQGQWAVIEVVIDDDFDTAPEFRGASQGIVTSGFSTDTKTGNEVGYIEAFDRDCNDTVFISVSSDFMASDPSLPGTPANPPFRLEPVPIESRQVCFQGTSRVNIHLQFDAQPFYRGYYEFQVTANDSVGYTAKALCRVYVVEAANVLNFYFTNELQFLQDNSDALSDILTDEFHVKCNVDRVFISAAVDGAVVVATHFVNVTSNKPVPAEYITAQQFKPVFYKGLSTKLEDSKFYLRRIGESDELPESDMNQIIIYVLAGGVAVVVISFLILAATCYYNNKGLLRRVRALSANAFGSQQSDLNKAGVSIDAPNTNTFAVEGSNPMWTIHTDSRKIPDFDTDSVGSGGSVLIGAEDEDYFQKSSKNPMFQVDDVVANYDSDNVSDQRSYFDNNNDAGAFGDKNAFNNEMVDDDVGGESPFPPKMSKNPLMNFGDDEGSIDVDDVDYGDEAFQFEGNTDVGLF